MIMMIGRCSPPVMPRSARTDDRHSVARQFWRSFRMISGNAVEDLELSAPKAPALTELAPDQFQVAIAFAQETSEAA